MDGWSVMMDQSELLAWKRWTWGVETLGGGATSSDALGFPVEAPKGTREKLLMGLSDVSQIIADVCEETSGSRI